MPSYIGHAHDVLHTPQVHAFTAVQLLLKSASLPLRRRVSSIVGGCLASDELRPNLFGALLAELLTPAAALLHAARWALSQQGGSRSGRTVRPPDLALHVRALSDWRAGNLSQSEVEDAVANAAHCFTREAVHLSGRRADGRPVRAVIVSSSPQVRGDLERRLGGTGSVAAGVEVITFEWQRYLRQAPLGVAKTLQASEEEAAAFCRTVDQAQAFRCNRTAHIHDWGPEPHWVALVELLLTASARVAVVGAGYPFFKVCNTFTQIAASLADAAPRWLHDSPPPSRVRLICASRSYSTDWGSSAWRSLGTRRNGTASTVVQCGKQSCMPVPLHPELWPDMRQPACDPRSSSRSAPRLPDDQGGLTVHFVNQGKRARPQRKE